MKIVIDTNVVISGTFFGGFPRKVLEEVEKTTFLLMLHRKLLKSTKKSSMK